MTGLPAGWTLCKIGDVLEPVEKTGKDEKDREIWYVDISSIDNKSNRIKAPKRLNMAEAPSRARQKIQAGDVLFSTVRPYLRNIAPVGQGLDGEIASTGFAVLRGIQGIEPKYLFYKCISYDFVSALTGEQYGVSYPAVKEEQVKEQPLELPPTNEQHRIAEKVEALFDEINRGVESLRDAKRDIELYRQSLLKSAFEGRLTADWRAKNPDKLENPEVLLASIREERDGRYQQQLEEWIVASTDWSESNDRNGKPKKPLKPKTLPPLSVKELNQLTPLPATWRWIRVADIGLVGTGVTPLRSNNTYYEGGNIGWITSGALNNPVVKVSPQYVTEAALNDTNLRICPPHTLLIALYGEGKTRGKCSELLIPAATNQAIAAIVQEATSANFRKFLKWFFTKNYEEIRASSSGGVQPNLNLGIIENTPIPLCSAREAKEIVMRIEARTSQIQAVEVTTRTPAPLADA